MRLDLSDRLDVKVDENGTPWVNLPQLLIVVEGASEDGRSWGLAILADALRDLRNEPR